MSESTPLRIAVLLSGSGTSLQNLLDLCAGGRLPAQIVLVVSNKPDAYGLTRAKEAGVPAALITRKGCASREEFSRQIFDRCRAANADLVCMAGFMQLVTIPDDFTNRVMNVHPALIPAFCGQGYYGQRVHEAVLEFGAKVTGCTIHFADNEYDHGPIILQQVVHVNADDTPKSLAARVQEAERQAYPEAIALFAAGALTVEGRIVRVDSQG